MLGDKIHRNKNLGIDQEMKYRPEIDGLRALAVLPVMLFHGGLTVLSGGFVGVDIFFVISGFLITSIIFKEIEAGKFSFINFYERRARRILPALYFVLLTCIPLAWFFLIPQDYVDFSNSLMGVVTFISNIVFWQQLDYFSPGADYLPLLHTWSLAIEEQYYFFFPILLIILYKVSTKAIFWGMSILFIGSLLSSHIGATLKPSATYYLLPTRLWELLIGSVIALMLRYNSLNVMHYPITRQNVLSLLGFILIALSLFVIDENTPFPSLWALLPTLGAGLIILFANDGTLINQLLRQKLFVGIGLISYSAYLWHQPIYVFLRHQNLLQNTPLVTTAGFIASLILAYISWKFIEAPFRNKKQTSRQFVFITCFIISLVILLVGWVGVSNGGFKGRFKLHPALTAETFSLARNDNGSCFYSVDTDRSLPIGDAGHHCTLGANNAQLKGILFGDSYAGMYEPFWNNIGNKHGLHINAVTTNWCFPSFTETFHWYRETPAEAQCLSNRTYVKTQLENIDFIVLAAVWSEMPPTQSNEIYNLIDTLLKTTAIDIILMPEPAKLTRKSVMRKVYLNGKLEASPQEIKAVAFNRKLAKIAESNTRVHYINRRQLFTSSDSANEWFDKNELPYSWDGGHISIYGSKQASDNFMKNNGADDLMQFLKKTNSK